MKRKRRLLGSTPVVCDVCRQKFSGVFYDFRLRQGRWALGCETCFLQQGCGLGEGRGHKYDLTTLEKLGG